MQTQGNGLHMAAAALRRWIINMRIPIVPFVFAYNAFLLTDPTPHHLLIDRRRNTEPASMLARTEEESLTENISPAG